MALAGDRLSIGKDIHEVDTWNGDDIAWLRRPTPRPDSFTPPVGRYNAGKKLNTIFTVQRTLAFGATGPTSVNSPAFPTRSP